MRRPPPFMARQLARPTGFFGRYVMGRFLNRTTADHNQMVLEDLAVTPESRVLEVGFGGAALLQKLCEQAPGGFVAGLDVSEEMIALARRRLRRLIASGRLEVHRGSVESMPFRDGEFDRACSVNTIYFWRDLAKGLAEFHRVIRPGGRLVLGFVAAEDVRGAGLDQQGFSPYSQAETESALDAAGFQPGRIRSGADSRGTFSSLVAERRLARSRG
jgi:SAM-dependent methyltransferase